MSELTETDPATSNGSPQSEDSNSTPFTDFSNQQPIAIPKPPENPANTVPSKTLWMGDLEAWWDEAYIAQIWENMGKHVDVKVTKPKNNLLMHQLAKTNGQGVVNHSGYCFIEFESPELANDALTLNGKPIPDSRDKHFRLNWASAATLDSQIAQTPEYSLFVGDLSTDTTEAHLLALFQSHFDSIKTVRVMTDPSSGLSRCFGFVRFTNDEDRKKALVEMNGQWLGGRQIRVALASPKHQNGIRNKYQQYPNQFNLQSSNYMRQDLSQGQQFLQHPPSNQDFDDPTNTTVFVGGLANGLNEDTLMALFEAFGPIIDIKVPPGKGCGFVKFIERKDAENAIEGLHGFVIGGSRIRLSWGRPSKSRNYHNVPHGQHMHNIPPMSMGMNMGMGMNMIPPNSMNNLNMSFNNMSLESNDALSPPPGMEPGFMHGLPHPISQGIPQMPQSMPQGIRQVMPQGLPQGLPQGMPQPMPGMAPHFIYDPYFGNPVAAPPPPPPSGIDDGQPHFMYVPPGYSQVPTMNTEFSASPDSTQPEDNDNVEKEKDQEKEQDENHASQNSTKEDGDKNV